MGLVHKYWKRHSCRITWLRCLLETLLPVDKLICVTGIGAGDSKGHGGFLYDKILNPLFLKTIYEDKDIQEKMVQDSTLEWLIVRPGFLTNGAVTGKNIESGVDQWLFGAYLDRCQPGRNRMCITTVVVPEDIK